MKLRDYGWPGLVPSVLLIAALAITWSFLVAALATQWSNFAQYRFGFAVPFLVVYILWRRLADQHERSDADRTLPPTDVKEVSGYLLFLAILASFLYLPTRLIQDANPDWRPLLWVQAGIAILLTLFVSDFITVATAGQRGARGVCGAIAEVALRVRPLLLFPLLFFLTGIPWPTLVEQPLIQCLTKLDAWLAVHALGLFSIPAIQHGNLIEVGTGVVGIDEACSGIRSLQAIPMVAIIVGELHRLRLAQRFRLLAIGIGIVLCGNFARTTLLTVIVAKKGNEAVAQWHDPAGTAILVMSFLGVWWVAARVSGGKQGESHASDKLNFSSVSFTKANRWALCVGAFILGSELAVSSWYALLERQLPQPVAWTVETTSPRSQLPAKTVEILRSDEAWTSRWSADGVHWQVTFVRWEAKRTAGYLSQVHNPQTCLPSSGFELRSMGDVEWVSAGGIELPYRPYVFEKSGTLTHVFFTVWDDRRYGEPFAVAGTGVWFNRVRAVWTGRGSSGQRLLEVALTGNLSSAEARKSFAEYIRGALMHAENQNKRRLTSL